MRSFLAPNPGPFTLTGTRSYVVGGSTAAVIDPGPAIEEHIAALAEAVHDAREVLVLLTHAHGDHAEGARELARRTGGEVWGPGGGRDPEDGQVFATGGGNLVAVRTPGHARRHFCFHLPGEGAVFTGDLILGEGDTTWVGEYPGGVRDYLDSLDRLEALGARLLLPGHGDPLLDPAGAIARFRHHRMARIEQVRRVIAAQGPADARTLARRVYGPLQPDVFNMAVSAVEAILDYLSDAG